MDVDRVMLLDVAHQLEVPLERDVGVVPALEQDLHAADRLALVDLGADLLEAEHVAFLVLRAGDRTRRTCNRRRRRWCS